MYNFILISIVITIAIYFPFALIINLINNRSVSISFASHHLLKTTCQGR